jgi:hypothetical protein
MKKQLFILLVLMIISTKISSQRIIDTLDIVTNAKMFFLNQDNCFYTVSQVLYFLNDTSNYAILNSKGFDDELAFIKIKTRGNFEAVRNGIIPDSVYQKNKVPFSCDYILGCKLHDKQFFRLKGFVANDFKLIFKKKYKQKEKEIFLNMFWINELDLSCLFDSFFLNMKSKQIYPCTQSCSERDKKFVKVRS